jgi:hypothetical protein
MISTTLCRPAGSLRVLAFAFAMILVPTYAQATPVSIGQWTGSGTSQTGVAIAAEADFVFDSSTKTLTITLINTSKTKTTDPGSILTGFYFNLGTTLTPVSAALGSGAFLVGNSTDKFGATQVGQGWAYGHSTSGGVAPPTGDGLSTAVNTGIVGAGYGKLPGSGNGNFAAGGVPLDGVAWGIVPSANGTTGVPDGGTNNQPVINHSLVFTLTSTINLTSSSITGVEFSYGTGNGEGGFLAHTVPEPSALAIGLISICGFGTTRIIRKLRRRPE